MEIPVLIEPVEGNGFRATSGPPLNLYAEGATSDEAMQNLRALAAARMANGVRVGSLQVPVVVSNKPWTEFAGMFKDDPYFDEVVEIMAENRRRMDADPDVP